MSSVVSKSKQDMYTIRLSKGASLIPETRLLLREWSVGEDAA